MEVAMIIPSDYEHPTADPAMVDQLLQAISVAIVRASIPNVTTTADVLSALFTTLDRALTVAQQNVPPDEASYNAIEINRVLCEFLVEYGNVTKH